MKMNVRVGESSAPSTRIDITVSPTPHWQLPDDGDGISDGLSAGLAADSNDLTGLSDSFSRSNLNHQAVDDDNESHLLSVNEVQSYPTTPDRNGGGRIPGSPPNSAASTRPTTTTTLRDGYMPPAPTPPQPRQRAPTVQSRAHVPCPTEYINNTSLESNVDEREGPGESRASPLHDREPDLVPPPPRLDHLLSTLQITSLYLTPPHLHPKIHHLLDPTILAAQLHTQTFEPAVFGIRLAEVLLQVCAPRRDGPIIELVGNMCRGSGAEEEEGGSGGEAAVTRSLRHWCHVVEMMKADVEECHRKHAEAMTGSREGEEVEEEVEEEEEES